MRRPGARVLVATLVGVLLLTGAPGAASIASTAPTAGGPAALAHADRSGRSAGLVAQPVVARDFPDPTVVHVDGRWVAIGTGPRAPRAVASSPAGPWRTAGRALTRLPRWVRDDSIWASDLVRGPRGWLLYYSALVRGLGPDARCVGVATAASPLDDFVSRRRPLVCPTGARAPGAGDIVNPPGVPTPAGVIDPDTTVTGGGRRYLTYRTQGLPATIRLVRLSRSGTRVVPGQTGVPILASTGVVENPVLLRRRGAWVLLTSEGYYGSCDYRTTYRTAPDLAGLAAAPRHGLLDRRRTGMCGPGGADLTGSLVFFHSWTCSVDRPHCRARVDYQARPSLDASRSMFAARLRWRGSKPRIASYVVPVAAPPVVAADTDRVAVPRQDSETTAPDGPGVSTTADGGSLLDDLLPVLGIPVLLPGLLPGLLP